jgi:2,4-dienoyl-CoA reductase-like NADH-dependent reductase (Old Yellow Enzyme family)
LCHGYLLGEFRDPRMNKRTDRYGGSEENRHRLLVEITDQAVRAAKGENHNMVVGTRVDITCVDGGFDFEDTKRLASKLQEVGIEYYHLTFGPDFAAGSTESGRPEDGMELKYARELKKILKIPVITPSVHDPKLAEQAISEGWTDMVSNAHQFIADPQFVNKLKEGREKDIVKCDNCGLCGARGPSGLDMPVRCGVNPEVGFERYNPKYQIRKGFKGAGILPHVLRK